MVHGVQEGGTRPPLKGTVEVAAGLLLIPVVEESGLFCKCYNVDCVTREQNSIYVTLC